MADKIVPEILHPSGDQRVILVRRDDGRFTYRKQERLEAAWGPETINAGVYDSADTAELEARQRVVWLRDLFH